MKRTPEHAVLRYLNRHPVTLALSLLALASFTTSAFAADQPPSAEEIAAVNAYLTLHLHSPRGMEQVNLGSDSHYPGWEGFTLIHWRYTTDDRKSAEVLMLNPTNDQIARWIVTACHEVGHPVFTGSVPSKYAIKLCDQIIGQSGGQFPVAGIVYEDMGGGPFLVWGFRDGVTVGYEGITNEVPDQVTPDQIKASLNRATKLRYEGYQARLESITRDEYRLAGGKEEVNGAAFLDVNRRLYQAAWNSDRNQMLIYWAKIHLK
jgi:hypothetical protein